MKICILSGFGDLTLKDTGSSVRTYNLAKSLAELGNKVHIVIPGDKATFEWIDKVVIHSINGFCPIKILELFSNLLGILRANSLFFYDLSFILRAYGIIIKCDIIQIEQAWASGLVIPLLTKILKKPLIVDSHDAFQALRVKHTSIPRKIIETFLEKIAYRFADIVLTVSEKDKKLLIRYGVDKDKIVIVPNGVDTQAFSPVLDATRTRNSYYSKDFYKVVFVGNMEYLPNQEAVRVIATDLAPKIKSKIKNVKFIIVGRVPPSVLKLGSCDLTFTGVVKNVAEFLSISDVAIAPLFHGSGTRLKILEYFSCGLPVVSTPMGVEGLEVKNGENVLIEDDMDEFATKVTILLKDRALSMKLGNTARDLVIDRYDWRKIGIKLDTVYHNLISDK